MSGAYQASQIKRVRATKSQVDERREELYRIVQRMRPMSVRQVYYQATVHGIGLDSFVREAVEQAIREAWDTSTPEPRGAV
jgi:hypothetical protein